MAETVAELPRPARSGSINAMLDAPQTRGAVTAGLVARYLLDRHREYAGGQAADWPVLWAPAGQRRTAEQWVTACEALLAAPGPDAGADEALAVPSEPVPRMTTRACVLLLGVLDPPTGRAMLLAGLTAALLDEYEPVQGAGLQPMASVLRSAAAQRARSVPILATAFGLAVPQRWDPVGLPGTRSSAAASPPAVAVGWSTRGEPVVGFADGTVRVRRGGEEKVRVADGPWQVGDGPDGPWAEPDVERDAVATPGRSSSGRSSSGRGAPRPVGRSVLGTARVEMTGIGPGARPGLTVTAGASSCTVPLQGMETPWACAVSDDARTLVAVFEAGVLTWVTQTGALAGSPVWEFSSAEVGGSLSP